METKTVYQLDANGVFVGENVADESPLEQGVFLIPGGCIEIPPPPHIEGEFRAMVDGAWKYFDIVQAPTEGEEAPLSHEQLAAKALAYRDFLLSVSALRIAPLQDAADLGIATPEEEASLLAWKQCRVNLSRIEQQAGFPDSIEWPVAP